ncbi:MULTISPECIES: GNAT family N-acetyltransferase [unclassified Aerococcus]|uniref:GNAT family N-acetyltransferase n=1 Tax=unclassified Aerococcus TaxID=2618060 RepID=UPI0025C13239|nr:MULTISPECIES: GNAT family N-acetyltransferase [unclassified Aerococcus]
MANVNIANVDNLIFSESDYINFDCGVPKLNEVLINRITPNGNGYERTNRMLVLTENHRVVAYMVYSLDRVRLAKDIIKTEEEKIPVLKINFIAVDKHSAREGYGTYLINFAFRIMNTISPFVELKGVFLEALEEAVPFYEEKVGFENLNATQYDLYKDSSFPETDDHPRTYQMYINDMKILLFSDIFPPLDYSLDYI